MGKWNIFPQRMKAANGHIIPAGLKALIRDRLAISNYLSSENALESYPLCVTSLAQKLTGIGSSFYQISFQGT